MRTFTTGWFSVFIVFLLTTPLMTQLNDLEEPPPPEPLFSVRIMIPTSGATRIKSTWYYHLDSHFIKIGINAESDYVGWAAIGPRTYYTEVGPFNEGGYDIALISMSLGTPFCHLGAVLQAVFGGDSIPPDGFNIVYWSPETGKGYNNYRAQESDNLIKAINNNTNMSNGRELLWEWQKIWYDVMPIILIHNQCDLMAISKGLYGYDPVFPFPLSSAENFWTTSDYTGMVDEVVQSTSAPGDLFMSIIARDVYDKYSANLIHDGLVANTPSKQVLIPKGTDHYEWMKNRFHDKYGTMGISNCTPALRGL